MKDHEVRESLRISLSDGQLDKAERDGFRDWLEKGSTDGHKRALYQSMAFELAGEALNQRSLNPHSILNWLERIVKILTPLAPAGPAPVHSEACFSPDGDCASRIIHAFSQARHSVDVCVFTITDDRISAAMETAKRRGVRIRLITDNEKLFDPGSDIDRLEQAGIEVRVDRTEFHMHHKFAIFDGSTLLTGSYNWTRSAALHNEENFIFTTDPKLLSAFRDVFEGLWKKFANS